MRTGRTTIGGRIVAVLLIAGGVVGVAMVVVMAPSGVTHWLIGAIFAAMAFVFVWSAITGVRLWLGTPGGWRWAIILFAAQVPVLTVPGATWEFYTGLSFRLMYGDPARNLHLGIGSLLNGYLDLRITGLALGVNLVALLALAYLLWARPRTAAQPAPAVQFQP